MPTELRVFLVIAALCFVGFRVYRRVRGSIGQQPLRQSWLILRALLLLLACGVALSFSREDPSNIALYATGGAIIGSLVSVYAMRHTEIEHTSQGYFYTGHPYIGLGIVGLFVGRLFFIFATSFSRLREIAAEMKSQGGSIGDAMAQLEGAPLTLGVLTLMTSYYVIYSLALLRKARQLG